ncbi:hypothetical protein QUF90_18955 [Desulfococcaceae bacterium HSG9]|nr:hypothetical protein [Desulfococcaceae bacterium HSG9]
MSSTEISENGTVVHLKGYRFVKIFGTVTKNANTEYQAANDLTVNELRRIQYVFIGF